jgi:Carboxypeptidase regulatory-like domain
MYTRLCCLWSVLLLALVSIASISSAQTTFGSVVGTVTDASGAAIANTQVTLTNVGTNEKRTETTNADGLYQFVNVLPGQYTVEVAQSGFNRIVRGPFAVETQSTARIDLALQVGEVTQTIEVTAQTPLLQPETSSLGQVIDQRKTNELPLNGRNPMNLVALVPSVVPQGGSMANPNGQNPFAWGNYQIGGGMANQSMTWLDGSPVNGAYINITALIPTQDSLQEFKVATNNLSPEYGRFAGGVVNFTTKSGTNELHGSAYEFLRNRELNANTFFNNLNGTPRPAFTQNQFGANLGGPVYIPKLYDGRNKTFFFVNYEGFRLRQGQSTTQTVPTALDRTGDLSNYIGRTGRTGIYDPLTTCGSGAPGLPACAPGQSPYARQPFPGNVIPVNRINPTSLRFLNLYPLPNAPGDAQGNGNWVANGTAGGNNNETVVRIDQNVSDKQHISARYSYWGNLNLPNDPFRNGVCQDRCTETFNTNNFVLGDTYTFTPTTIMEVRLSYQRFSYDRIPSTLGYDLTQLGWPASLNSQVSFRDLPIPVINGFDLSNTFGSQGAGSVIVDRNDNYRAAATLTRIAGNHTLKFGAEWLRMTHNYAQTNIPTGIFNFNPDLTGNNGLNPSSNSGAGLATFLLGYPSSGNASTPNLVAGQQLYPAVFGNDDWHVNPRLTLNLGVRWEHSGPWTERFDRLTYFNPTKPNQILAARGITVPGNVDLVNSTGDSYRSNIYPNWYQFSPRAGLAYQVTSKTVFHAGYGVFWLPNNVAWDYSPNNNPINSLSTPILAPVYPGVPATVISNPFPGGIAQPPGRNPSYAQILLGRGITVPELENPYGYAQQWNADLQQQFGNGFLIDIAYGGAKGTHLPISSPNINQLPDQFLSLGDQLTTNVPNPYYGIVTAPGVALSQPTVQYGQLLRRYPQYDTVGYAGQGIGNSSYQSLQVKAEKRFSGGNTILVAYTHAKLIANTETVTGWLESGGTGGVQDWNNLKGERSLASFDVPDRLVASYVLDIPVGKGRKYLANANGFIQSVVGGWGVQGTTTLQSGFPLHFTTNQNNTHSFGGGSRPNAVLGCQKSVDGPIQAKLNNYFNTSCFTQPAPYTFGNESRTDPNLRAPGIANWDFAAVKGFPLSPEGRTNLVFRAEFFNIFNRVQFGYPNQTLGNTAFGRITSQVNNPRLVQFALQLRF